jgi:hypothetical protein
MRQKFIFAALLMLAVIGCKNNKSDINLVDCIIYDENKTSYMFNITNKYPAEVLINDFPVLHRFDFLGHKVSGSADVGIYTDGTQAFEIIMDLQNFKKEGSEEPILSLIFYKTTPDKSSFDIDEENIIADINIYEDDITTENISNRYFSKELNFEAQPSVNMNAWLESEDMTKQEKDKLLKMVYMSYQDFKDVINNKKIPEFVDMIKIAEYESGQLSNKKAEWLKDEREAWLSNSLQLLPINDCKIKLYGNGKLVTLTTKSNKIISESPIYSSLPAENNGKTTQFVNLYYHFPTGSDYPELIRFNAYSVTKFGEK